VKTDPLKFEQTDRTGAAADRPALPSIVRNLRVLLDQGAKFSTIYADPPWPYSNTAARGAAEKHYRTLTLDSICKEPVKLLAAEKAHLHLWTTNGFLREAFDVIRAWGFEYKSCLIWIKPQLGMGNYWRVSHELLVLGVRGGLQFSDRTCRSWLAAPRTVHSRKPFAFRALVERVSPGPYLELYGREEQPNTGWTVYGDQVERRLF
jgi:N6-adenosine-specific RNA methylase IME4